MKIKQKKLSTHSSSSNDSLESPSTPTIEKINSFEEIKNNLSPSTPSDETSSHGSGVLRKTGSFKENNKERRGSVKFSASDVVFIIKENDVITDLDFSKELDSDSETDDNKKIKNNESDNVDDEEEKEDIPLTPKEKANSEFSMEVEEPKNLNEELKVAYEEDKNTSEEPKSAYEEAKSRFEKPKSTSEEPKSKILKIDPINEPLKKEASMETAKSTEVETTKDQPIKTDTRSVKRLASELNSILSVAALSSFSAHSVAGGSSSSSASSSFSYGTSRSFSSNQSQGSSRTQSSLSENDLFTSAILTRPRISALTPRRPPSLKRNFASFSSTNSGNDENN